ncbi:MAG TPA: hypothetical protein PK539_03435 [Candidatus Paceibacterota bacterium]|nr:hypothetical protein [Candidatus Paceibacterota bacterium]
MQDMIQFRGLNVEHVKLAIREPDWTKKTFQGRLRACKQVGRNKAVRVVYYKDGFRDSNDYIVITAYYSPSC